MSNSERLGRLPLHEAPEEGTVRIMEIAGRTLGLYKVEGELYALADRCPHRGGPLCSAGAISTPVGIRDGAVKLGDRASVVRCPWHKWEFDIASGRCLSDPRLRVRRYAVRVDGDEIVVTLDHPQSRSVDRDA